MLSSAKFQLRPRKRNHQKISRTVSVFTILYWAEFISKPGYVYPRCVFADCRVDMSTRASKRNSSSL